MTRQRLLAAIVVYALVSPVTVDAVVIDNMRAGTGVVAFGEPAVAYYAQSFTAITDNLVQVKFLLASAAGPGPTPFHFLITETAGGTGESLQPTNVIFESAELSVPFDPSSPFNRREFTTFTVDVGNLLVHVGSTYAFILDGFVTLDGVSSEAGAALNTDYPNGHFFYYARSPIGGTRASHFANTAAWNDYLDEDLAFRLTFVDVPEPSSIALLCIGVFMSTFTLRRFR